MLLDWLLDPWIWLGAALALLLAELVVSGYVLLSFSFGAALMALGLMLWSLLFEAPPVDPDTGALLPLLLAWMLATALSAAGIWVFWRGRRARAPASREDDVNNFSNHL